jgi:hypothetical protein
MYRRTVEPFGYPLWEEKADRMRVPGHSARTTLPVYRGEGIVWNFRKLSIRHPHTNSVASRRARSGSIFDILTAENAEELKGDFSWSLQKW